MSHRFLIADVFTNQAFGGNQLAIFPDAHGISDALMQRLAREFNFSETTFVLPTGKPGHTHRVRIFTPGAELPFAGHPNIGTAVALAAEAGAPGQAVQFLFEEGVGPVAVEARAEAGKGFARLTLERAPELRALDVAHADLVAMLALPQAAIGPRAAWAASIGGTPFCCIPLADRDAVAAARLDLRLWEQRLPQGVWAREVYAIAGDFAPGGWLKVRMWAPSVGVPEDPATGSAAAMLAASLAAMLPDPEGSFAWTIEQGAEIGRPSLIEAEADKSGGKVVRVRVGGSAVIVGEGRITIPG